MSKGFTKHLTFGILLFFEFASQVGLAKDSPSTSGPTPQQKVAPPSIPAAEPCSSARETVPAKVTMAEVFKDILRLKDTQNRTLIPEINPELDASLRKLFEADPKTISKLEQFFGLLFQIAKHKSISDRKIVFSVPEVRATLISSKVFSDPTFPNHLTNVVLYWSSYLKKASYEVKFDKKEVILPLNAGKGFGNFSEGMCQVAEKLIFYGGFNFDTEMTRNANVYVSNFRDLDLFGKFGSRGTIDVDIQYVSIKSVEFLAGSPLGTVRAKVSKREFEINEHSWLLKVVSKLVTDKSTQPIDW